MQLPRRVAHRRDAREVTSIAEIQRAREVERRRIRQVEALGADLEPPGTCDHELLGDAEVELAQRRTRDLAAPAAERAEVVLPDRPDRSVVGERRRVLYVVHVLLAPIPIADHSRLQNT